MFRQIFVERQVADHPRTMSLLNKLRRDDPVYIRKVEDIFGRVHKPYLQKRDSLDLFIGRKEGELVKPAPQAYGVDRGHHYFFIHAYNCIFECQYCYLQGYFSSPDIVLFVNHEEIIERIKYLSNKVHPGEEVWFHAGEYSDSLALSGLTDEWKTYWDCFAELPNGILELRSKSGNIRPIKNLPPLKNIIPTFSLTPEEAIEEFDQGTAPLKARLRAISALVAKGYQVGIHCDPVIDSPGVIGQYQQLAEELLAVLPPDRLAYLSMGVVRFTKKVHRATQQNYPQSRILGGELISGDDGLVRYCRPHRGALLRDLKQMMIDAGYPSDKIYLCME